MFAVFEWQLHVASLNHLRQLISDVEVVCSYLMHNYRARLSNVSHVTHIMLMDNSMIVLLHLLAYTDIPVGIN